MKTSARIVNAAIKGLTGIICSVDDSQLERVPAGGPLIIAANHVNFIEVPILITRLQPRPVTGFAKSETWDNPALAYIFDLWEAIPIRRGEADLKAIRQALAALEQGRIVAVAPEGTRSGDGRLQRGHPGVVILALKSGAPILPIVYYGGEKYRENLPRLRRTDFRIVVGNRFYLQPGEVRVDAKVRRRMTDEIMYQLAALLPPGYRGEYADFEAATEQYLRFPEGSRSNLQRS